MANATEAASLAAVAFTTIASIFFGTVPACGDGDAGWRECASAGARRAAAWAVLLLNLGLLCCLVGGIVYEGGLSLRQKVRSRRARRSLPADCGVVCDSRLLS